MKLHQLSSSWSDVKKASYVKHAVREYKIHRQLRYVLRLLPSINAYAACIAKSNLSMPCLAGSRSCTVVALVLCMFMLLHLGDAWAASQGL